ncbi:MAG: hypothetical protein K2J61_04365 [Clostridia bacterium]|nr:hypothetical protein [Clostridia bacterium]
MKKRNTALLTVSVIIEAVRIITLPFAIIIILLTGILIADGCSNKDIKRYHDIEIYIQQKYLDKEEFGEQVYYTGAGVDYFIPKFEEIEYNYSDIDFYIFDGTATLSHTAVTFALDLKFSDKNEYESAKQNELSTRTFMTEYAEKKQNENPVFEFNLGNFSCKTVDGSGFPRRVRFICLDDSNYVLRYLVFEEWESPEFVKDATYILNCTNCPWNN